MTTDNHATLKVDHIEELKDRPDLALEESDLRTLCRDCHNKRHHRFNYRPKKKEIKWDDEKTNEDIENGWGNYLYECLKIPLINKVINCYWDKDRWLVETISDMSEREEDMYFAAFKGRGSLERLMG